jgi:hypothetical protein
MSCLPCFIPFTPQGLLRAALDQEAELAKHIEGYSYSPTGNKYDTKTFYYHSSAQTHTLRSKYSAQEHPDPVEGGDTESAGIEEMVAARASAGKLAPPAGVPAGEVAAGLNGQMQSMFDNVYAGSDAHLIRKLILLEQERKLFSLVHDQGKVKAKGAVPHASAVVNADSEYSTSADIFIDPIVLKILPPEYEQHHKFPPVESCEVGSITPEGMHVVDVARLNQTWYYEHPTASAPTADGTLSSDQPNALPQAVPGTPLSSAEASPTAVIPASAQVSAAVAASRRLLQKPVLVIIRHGKTEHNKLGLFTGWEDAALSPEGRKEARYAGKLLRRHGVKVSTVVVCIKLSLCLRWRSETVRVTNYAHARGQLDVTSFLFALFPFIAGDIFAFRWPCAV